MVLDDENYLTWKVRCEVDAKGAGVYRHWTGEEPCPQPRKSDKGEALPLTDSEKETQRKWQKRDDKATSLLYKRLPNNVVRRVSGKCKTSAEAWKMVCSTHEQTGLHSEMMALSVIRSASYQDGEPHKAYITQWEDAIERLDALDATIPDRVLALFFFHSLPPSFSSLKSTLTALHRDTFTFRLIVEGFESECRMRIAGTVSSSSSEQAMYAASYNKSKQRSKQGGGQEQQQGRQSTMGMYCTFCERRDSHMIDTCRKRLAQLKSKQQQKQQQPQQQPQHQQKQQQQGKANIADELFDSEDEKATLVLSLDEHAFLTARLPSTPDVTYWHVDSGASYNYCSDPSLFATLLPVTGQSVSVADGVRHTITGVGRVGIDFPVLQDCLEVRCSPTLKYNLLSVKAMGKAGWKMEFENDVCQILAKDRKTIIATAKAAPGGGLYTLALRRETPLPPSHLDHALLATAEQMLWHERTGHLHAAGLSLWAAQRMTADGPALPALSKLRCLACSLSKANRLPFPKKARRRATCPIYLVHIDVCGPFPVTALGGWRYFLLIVDDYSRFMWVAVMKTKAEALDHFKTYLAWAERQHSAAGHKLVSVRSDNGGEFVSRAFTSYLDSLGIHHELTAVHTPQQNGVVERANRTVVGSARTMITAAGLPKSYWAAAVRTAVYLRNRLPTSAVQGMTPHEAFFGVKPEVSDLRRFGCHAFVRVPTPNRGKLDERARSCVFVGYCSESKAWRFYHPPTRTTFRSRDVQWEEDVNGLTTGISAGGGTAATAPSAPSTSSLPPSAGSSYSADTPVSPPAPLLLLRSVHPQRATATLC